MQGNGQSMRKESTTPKGVAFLFASFTQGSLLSSATLGYRKYNRDAVIFYPLPAHRNGWDGRAEGLPARPIGWNSLLDSLPIYSNGRKSRAEGLPAYSNRWMFWRGVYQYIQSDGIFEKRGCPRFQSDGMVGRSVCQYIQLDGMFGRIDCRMPFVM